ncbi:MAG TPA: metallophosphoesterase [Candidatus Angelobacter sp.]|nr:metallophosphoesterase [Candidatus Angelobacter sp.]
MNRLCLFVVVIILGTGSVVRGQMPMLSPLPKTGQLAKPADPAKFSFILAGDNRPAHKSCAQPPTPGKIFAAVQQMKPDFVIWSGDTIFGKQPDKPKRIHEQYKEFLEIARTGGVPVFNAPGNHELDDENNIPSDVMKKLYIEDMGATYGAFSYGNSRFIALNGEHEPAEGAPSAEVAGKHEAPGAITAKELAELKADLDANKDKAHIFLFLHHPVMPYGPEAGLDPASVKALQDLFAGYKNISYVVSGHEHMYYNPQGSRDQITPPPSRKDPSQPPYYLVSGGAGAPLKKNTPGSFFHYLVFKVDGDEITPTLVKVDSSDPCDQK